MIAVHVLFEGGRPAVRLNPDGRPQEVEQSAFDGLRVRKATVTGTGNSFVNNNRHGVQVEAMAATRPRARQLEARRVRSI